MNTTTEIVSLRFEIAESGTLATVEWLEWPTDAPDAGKSLQVRSAMFPKARTVMDIIATDIAQLQYTVWPFDSVVIGQWPVLDALAPIVIWQNEQVLMLCAPDVLPAETVLRWANERRPFARGVPWRVADMAANPDFVPGPEHTNPQPCPRLQAHRHWLLTR